MMQFEKLCEDLKVSVPAQKEGGEFTLELNEMLQIDVTPLESGAYFYSPIAACPEKKKEEFFIYLMKANLFGQGTMGASIGLKENENLLTLSRALTYDMEYGAFRDSLEDFANIVTFWREEIDRHNREATNSIL